MKDDGTPEAKSAKALLPSFPSRWIRSLFRAPLVLRPGSPRTAGLKDDIEAKSSCPGWVGEEGKLSIHSQ